MERAELLEILKVLKAGYIAALNDLTIMRDWGKMQLEALYSTKIGKFEVEILELKIQLKSLKKKIQLTHQAINQGKYPNFIEIEEMVSAMEKQAYRDIFEAKQKVEFGRAILSNLGSPEDSMELRKIYRNIAKSLHPDINPNLTAEQRELWHTFHEAYQNGDLEKIKALQIIFADQLKLSENSVKEISEEEILVQIAQLKQGIIELEYQKSELEKDFPFTLAEQIRDDEWVEEQQDRLQQKIAELQWAVEQQAENYQLIYETYGRQ